MFVATSAQSTTSYPLPLVAIDTNNQTAEVIQLSDAIKEGPKENSVAEVESKKIDILAIQTLDVSLPISIRREYVKAFFEHEPVLARIAFCESALRHNDKDGSVLRGRVDSRDIGIMQINERYHGDTARNLGYDIYTLRGNLAYARYLFEKQGVKPWSASEACWEA